MILLDTNVPMYLVGASHPNKISAQRLLEKLVSERRRLVTDAGVLREILHRYAAIGRRDAIQPAIDLVEQVVDEVFPVEHATVLRARDILLAYAGLSARDALHAAVMQQHGIEQVLSFDSGFDLLPNISRIGAAPV